jgi:2-keto-4-pentenoate hydratase/2-oxohepta-3-ene-1,7-dioic acid hydratase in catechol pathway
MRIIRYLDQIQNIKYAALQADEKSFEISGDIFGKYSVTDKIAQVTKLLAPVVPSCLLCIGLNYRRHAEECGSPFPKYPVLFMKSPTNLQNPGDPIELPRHLRSDKVDYEAELAVVIGRKCKNVSRDEALDYVLGYTCSNDVSARDWQFMGGGDQWCRGKSFDTFAPMGPCLVTTDEIPDPHALNIKLDIDGEVLQDWTTGDMIHDIPAIIEFLSGSTTLDVGTIILTGTPQGVGGARKPQRFMNPGEVVTVTIEKIGALSNPIIEEVC